MNDLVELEGKDAQENEARRDIEQSASCRTPAPHLIRTSPPSIPASLPQPTTKPTHITMSTVTLTYPSFSPRPCGTTSTILRHHTCCHCSRVHTFRAFSSHISTSNPHFHLNGMFLKAGSSQTQLGCSNPKCPHAFCRDCRVVAMEKGWECWACGMVKLGEDGFGCRRCGYEFGSEWVDRGWIEVGRSRKVEYKRWG